MIPEWFSHAIAAPYRRHSVEVAGCAINYLGWGDKNRPGLVFVPGSGGHAHWFSPIAPLLAREFHVVAMDIGGCGDSAWRQSYTRDLISDEILAVCADSGMLAAETPPILIGHSLGGQFCIHSAIAHGARLLGVIAVDSLRYAKLPGDPAIAAFAGPRPAPSPPKIYPQYEAAVARFRLFPEPKIPIAAGYMLDHIARHSVRQMAGGWSWKFDTKLAAVGGAGLGLLNMTKNLPCQVAAIYGEHTHLADDTMYKNVTEATAGKIAVFTLPGSSHYPMIDQPLEFVAAIKGVASAWGAAARRTL
jgi:pimeloyl-ACP methyl ester carboxylesterase